MRLSDRLISLFDHLAIDRAHVATQVPADIADVAQDHAERLGGVVLCTPTRLDALQFTKVAERVLLVSGDIGPTAEATLGAAERLAGAERRVLPDYRALGWSDVALDRGEEVADLMIDFLARMTGRGQASAPRVSGRGVHAGITWRCAGSGPPLVLLPFLLAPSQWTPVLSRLAQHFSVVVLGGRHLGGVALLEDRARAPSYRAMFGLLIDTMAPQPDDAILDVGCGAGSLDRLLARRSPPGLRITAIDVNPFLLEEARALAQNDGVADAIRFQTGNAEALPFADNSFAGAFSVTVLEECDTDKALSEMVRVLRPGGRLAIAVRAIDMPQWWNVPTSDILRRKLDVPPQSVAPNGVADATLYDRMRNAGLQDLVCFPMLVTLDRPDGPIWRYREDHLLSLLSPTEAETWQALRHSADSRGLLFMSHPMHCAVGTKPAR